MSRCVSVSKAEVMRSSVAVEAWSDWTRGWRRTMLLVCGSPKALRKMHTHTRKKAAGRLG